MRYRSLLVVLAAGLSACAEQAPDPTEVEVIDVPVVFSQANPHRNFQVTGTGAEEVPARTTDSYARATFWFRGDTLTFRLVTNTIHDVTQAHLHYAPAGVNGGIVVWLFPDGPPATLIPGRHVGLLNEGTITDGEVINALAGQGIRGVLRAMRHDSIYVNVHTSEFPGGEVRGQIDGGP